MSLRPVAALTALTAADYALWNWALGGGHSVIALVAGLTLPPLAAACMLALALAVARVLARSSQRSAILAGSLASSLAASRRRRRLATRRVIAVAPLLGTERSAGSKDGALGASGGVRDGLPPNAPTGVPVSAHPTRELAA